MMLPVGTYDVYCSAEGYYPIEVEDCEVTSNMDETHPPVGNIDFELDSIWDEDTVMVEFTSHESGEEVLDPFILLEGRVTCGEIVPDKLRFEFEQVIPVEDYNAPGGGHHYKYDYAAKEDYIYYI